MTDDIGELAPAATTDVLSAIARRIIEMEAIGADGVRFQLHADAGFRPDAEALDHLK